MNERSPEFRRFWWGEAVSGMGTAVTSLALQLIVLVTLHGDTGQVGWLNSVRWLPYLVLGLVVGALVDRVRRRPVMIATDLLRAGLLGLVPLAWALDVLSFPVLLVVVVLFGTVSLVNDAASHSFVPRLVGRSSLQRAHARLDRADAVAQTAGPALAGALIRVLGAPLAVLVDALSYLFSAVTVASLKGVAEPAPVRPARPGLRGLAREAGDGARWAYGGSGLLRLAVSTHVWFAGQAALQVVVVAYGKFQLDLTALQLGLVFAVAGLGALVGASTSTAVGRRLGSGGAIICSYAVSAVGVLVMLGAASASPGWSGAAVLACRAAAPRLGDGEQQLPRDEHPAVPHPRRAAGTHEHHPALAQPGRHRAGLPGRRSARRPGRLPARPRRRRGDLHGRGRDAGALALPSRTGDLTCPSESGQPTGRWD